MWQIRPGIYVFAWREKVIPARPVTIADHRDVNAIRSHGVLFGLDESGEVPTHFTFGAHWTSALHDAACARSWSLRPSEACEMTDVADLIVTGSVIRTAETVRTPWSRPSPCANGRILAVGARSDMEGLRGRRTRLLEVGDAAVYPGFVDVHNHHALGRAHGPVRAVARIRR